MNATNTQRSVISSIVDYIKRHEDWAKAVKPQAIVYVLGESNGTEIPLFNTPHFGWQSLDKSPAVIALYLIPGKGWLSAKEGTTVDEMLWLIKSTGRDVFLIATEKPTPAEVNEMAEKLILFIHPESFASQ